MLQPIPVGHKSLADYTHVAGELGRRLGRAGKEHVRRHFLTPRLLRDWLRIFSGGT
jgi:hypothetical protein